MTTTDTSERGLERLICTALTGAPCDPGVPSSTAQQRPATYAAGVVCVKLCNLAVSYCPAVPGCKRSCSRVSEVSIGCFEKPPIRATDG